MAVRKPHWAVLFGLIVLSGGILWLLSGRESIEEGRCKLVRKKTDPRSQLMELAFQVLQPQLTKPDEVRDLPPGFNRPCYYQIRSADKGVLMVVNLSASPSLCLDTDGDGILSQERCYPVTRVPLAKASSSSWRFGPICLVSDHASSKIDGGFYISGHRGNTAPGLTAWPAFLRTGKLRLAGQTYQVAVVDGDYDGRFHSFLSLPLKPGWRPVVDMFAIDLNHDGKFVSADTPRQGQSEIMPLSHLVRVADTYYTIDVSLDGTSLTLSKTEPPLGVLVVEPGDVAVELKLWSDAAGQCLPPGRQWQLPGGQYTAVYAGVEKKDASGIVWTFSGGLASAAGDLGVLDFFEIKPGETTGIKIGPPFVVKTEVQRAGPGSVSVDLVLTGCAGEQYRADFQRNGCRVTEPTFKIVDEKGTVLVADKFQYG